MKLIIFGPPAAGKGTQADFLVTKYNLTQVSTGDILRANISQGTELGIKADAIIKDGNLVDDETINEMVKDRLAELRDNFLLDGYPRTMIQATYLEVLPYKIDAAVNLEVPDEVIVERVINRMICSVPGCGGSYNLITKPPRKEGICSKCGGKLVHRPDDTEEAIRDRLNIYHKQTATVIEFYREKGLLLNINGNQSIKKVQEDIETSLS